MQRALPRGLLPSSRSPARPHGRGEQHRASGLALVTAAIALWNAVYLDRALDVLRQRGQLLRGRPLAKLIHQCRPEQSDRWQPGQQFATIPWRIHLKVERLAKRRYHTASNLARIFKYDSPVNQLRRFFLAARSPP